MNNKGSNNKEGSNNIKDSNYSVESNEENSDDREKHIDILDKLIFGNSSAMPTAVAYIFLKKYISNSKKEVWKDKKGIITKTCKDLVFSRRTKEERVKEVLEEVLTATKRVRISVKKINCTREENLS